MTETQCYYQLYGELINYVRHYAGKIIPLTQKQFIKLQKENEL